MDELALVISGLAFLAAGWSAVETYRMRRIERERRRGERAPDLTATGLLLAYPSGGRLHAVVIRNNGPEDLDEVAVELVGSAHGPVAGLRTGPRHEYASSVRIGGIRLGEGRLLDCDRRDQGIVRLRVEGRAGGDAWVQLVEFEWPREVFGS